MPTAIERIPLIGGKDVEAAVKEAMEKQAKSAFLDKQYFTTMRVCALAAFDKIKARFGMRELIQNWKDFVIRALMMAAAAAKDTVAPVRKVENGLEWYHKKELILGFYFTATGVDLLQPGGPISLDAASSGTQSKDKVAGVAGGFGDGMKTAILWLIMFGYVVTFKFRDYDENHPNRMLVWEWRAEVPCKDPIRGKFSEQHLVYEVYHAENDCKARGNMPTMVTSVCLSDATPPEEHEMAVKKLHKAAADSLSCFQELMFRMIADPKGRTVTITDSNGKHPVGSWRHTDCFEPVVDEIAPGYPVSAKARCAQVRTIAGGCWYPLEAMSANNTPQSVCIDIPGNGMRNEDVYTVYTVFNGPLREVCDSNMRTIVLAQFDAFWAAVESGNRDLEKQLVKFFMPLLRGGKSLMMNGKGVPGVFICITQCPTRSSRVCTLLLTHVLAGDRPSAKKLASARDQARNATLACSSSGVEKASYLKDIIDGGSVVKIDLAVANPSIFKVAPIEILEQKAAVKAIEESRKKRSPKARFMPKVLDKAVKYIAGDERVLVMRITSDVSGHKPYNFLFKFSDLTAIVYHLDPRIPDGIETIEAIHCHFRWSDEVVTRASHLYLQLMSNSVKGKIIKDRIQIAIEKARRNARFDVGSDEEEEEDEAKKRKKKEEEEDSGDESDSSTSSKSSSSSELLQPSKKPRKEEKGVSTSVGPLKYDKDEPIVAPRVHGSAPMPGLKSVGSGSSSAPTRTPGTHAPDLLATIGVKQTFAEHLGYFVASDRQPPLELTQEMKRRKEIFEEARSIALSARDFGNVKAFPSWTPDPCDWFGMYYPDSNMALINLAADGIEMWHMLDVMCHELAHIKYSAHDVRFMDEMEKNSAAVMRQLILRGGIPRGGAR